MNEKDKNNPGAIKFGPFHILLLTILLIAAVGSIIILQKRSGAGIGPVTYRPDTQAIPKPKKMTFRHGWRTETVPETPSYPASPRLSPPSNWVRSPNGKYTAYIDPLEWEQIGNLYLRDNTAGRIIQLTHPKAGNQDTPKSVIWLNDSLLLYLFGYAYGTSTVGGRLYLYNVNAFKRALVYDPGLDKEVGEVSVSERYIVMRIANFGPDALYYTLSSKVLDADSLLKEIRY